MAEHRIRRPSGLLKRFFDAPRWLYRHRLGWLLGRRFLEITHVGRRSGTERTTVLEVAVYHDEHQESIVASAYGEAADWYRNIRARPARLIRTGRVEYVPAQRFLDPDETRAAAIEFCRTHRLEAKAASRVFAAMGAVPKDTGADPVDLIASLPMVAFRPQGR